MLCMYVFFIIRYLIINDAISQRPKSNLYSPSPCNLIFSVKPAFCENKTKSTSEFFSSLYVEIKSQVTILSSSDDFSGEYLTNPKIHNKYTNVIIGDIILKDHVLIGSNSIVLPNVILAEGTAIGSNSLVKKSTNEWKIYGGVPIKEIKDRSRNCLELQCEYENEIKLNI